MSLDGAYDAQNPFALILSGKLPATKIWEDDDTLAFLDIMPQADGHALVVTKRSQARNLLEIEADALARVMATVQRVARALRTALDPDGIQIVQLNGADAGQTVFHLHVHVIPRWQGGALGFAPDGRPKADAARLAGIAEKVRAAIG